MDSIKKVFFIAVYNMKKWPINPRIYIIALIELLFLHSLLHPISYFCQQSGYDVTIYVFPYLMSNTNAVLIVMLGVVLLFCDAPFTELDQPYIILRSGRSLWVFGQAAYILLASFLYFMIIVLLSVLLLLPHVTWGLEWGKVIGTFAQTTVAIEQGIVVPFSFYIFNGYSPVMAMAISFFNCWLIASLLGMIMFLLNLNFSRFAGVLCAVILVLWQAVVSNTWTGFSYISPVSWVSLGKIDTTGTTLYPSLRYVWIVSSVLLAALSCCCMLSIRRRDIDVLKSV